MRIYDYYEIGDGTKATSEFLQSVSPEITMAWQETFGYVRFHD